MLLSVERGDLVGVVGAAGLAGLAGPAEGAHLLIGTEAGVQAVAGPNFGVERAGWRVKGAGQGRGAADVGQVGQVEKLMLKRGLGGGVDRAEPVELAPGPDRRIGSEFFRQPIDRFLERLADRDEPGRVGGEPIRDVGVQQIA